MTEEQAPESESSPAEQSIQRGSLVVLGLIIVTLVWYLASDRFTPYTDQARVEGFVVGIAPRVSGLVTQVHVDNNSIVEGGQPLFDIDTSDYQIALDRAKSERDKAQRQLQAGDATVTASRASLEAALANEEKNRKDFDRLTRLYEQDPGTISQRRLEVSQAALEAATAQVAMARADIERAIESKGGDDDSDNAFLRSAESAVVKAQLDLANTQVVAPRRGVITDLRTEVGQFAGTGGAVMTLVSTHDLWVNAAFSENNLEHIRNGTPVELLFDVLPGRVFKGSIRSIGLGISASQPPPPGTLPTVQNNRDWLRQAQRFPVQVDIHLDDTPELATLLRIGGQASVIAYTEEASLLEMLGRFGMRVRSWLSYAY